MSRRGGDPSYYRHFVQAQDGIYGHIATFGLANPTLAITYNPDGSAASTTENGVLTTFTYNTDGTVETQTRAGVTKPFTYDANGNVTGLQTLVVVTLGMAKAARRHFTLAENCRTVAGIPVPELRCADRALEPVLPSSREETHRASVGKRGRSELVDLSYQTDGPNRLKWSADGIRQSPLPRRAS